MLVYQRVVPRPLPAVPGSVPAVASAAAPSPRSLKCSAAGRRSPWPAMGKSMISIWFQYEWWNPLCLYVFLCSSLSIWIYLSISESIWIYLNLSESIWIYLSINLSIYLSIYLSINQSIYLSIYLSLHLLIYIYICLWFLHMLYRCLSLAKLYCNISNKCIFHIVHLPLFWLYCIILVHPSIYQYIAKYINTWSLS